MQKQTVRTDITSVRTVIFYVKMVSKVFGWGYGEINFIKCWRIACFVYKTEIARFRAILAQRLYML